MTPREVASFTARLALAFVIVCLLQAIGNLYS